MKIFCAVNISKLHFFISNKHCQELYLGNFNSNLDFFLHPQIPDFQIVVSWQNIVRS